MVAAGVGGIDGESVVVTVAEFPCSSVIWTVTIGRLAGSVVAVEHDALV